MTPILMQVGHKIGHSKLSACERESGRESRSHFEETRGAVPGSSAPKSWRSDIGSPALSDNAIEGAALVPIDQRLAAGPVACISPGASRTNQYVAM